MSYRNPKIYAPDPTAFSRGFSQGFGTTMQNYANQKENLAKEAKERQRVKAENEKAEAELLNKTDLGGYADLDNRIYDEFQIGIRGAIDFDEFSSLSPTEQEKYLFEIRDYKQGFDKFKQILAMPGSQLDARNKDLIELKTAVTKDPSQIKFKGSGTDMKILYTGVDGGQKEISVRDLNSRRIIDKTEIQNSLNTFDNEEFEDARKILKEGAKNNKFDNAVNYAEQRYRAQLANSLQEDEYAYIYHNELGGTGFENDPQGMKQAVIDYKVQGFKDMVEGERELQNILAPEPEEPTVDKPAKWEIDMAELKQEQEQLVTNPISQRQWDNVVKPRPSKSYEGGTEGQSTASLDDMSLTAMSQLASKYDFTIVGEPLLDKAGTKEIGFELQDNKTKEKIRIYKSFSIDQVMEELKKAKNVSDSNKVQLP